ncbi:MAG TPA: hypothetical protein VLA99_02635, partial [Nitrospiraceae bacterium]|nr:hypothetical protein [Nitrospiraceae bacterium]
MTDQPPPSHNDSRRPHAGHALLIMALLVGCSLATVWSSESASPRDKGDRDIQETKQKGAEGVDFSYDVFGAPPGQDPQRIAEEAKAKDKADKPAVMAQHAKILQDRYQLDCKSKDGVTMTKGKPQPIGPTVKLPNGPTWDQLSKLSPEDIAAKKLFPPGFRRLPHVKPAVGGQVFPDVQTKPFPRLIRFDVDFDLPDCFLPEFPPPIFLTTHPELGDVSQGEVLTAENFDRLFRG